MQTQETKYYVALRPTPTLREIYKTDKYPYPQVQKYIAAHLDRLPAEKSFDVRSLPSNDIDRDHKPVDPGRDPPTERFVVALDIHDQQTVKVIQDAVESDKGIVFLGSGADLPFSGTDHWCPRDSNGSIFSDRLAAERLLGVPYVRETKHWTGKGVNVVVVDQGLDQNLLGGSYGGGWQVGTTLPGTTKAPPGTAHRTHGMMIAANILKIAPDVKLFDLPMVPERITDIPDFFLSTADAAFAAMRASIKQYKLGTQFPGPWVIVNAWAVFDRASEFPPGDYTNNPNHPFNVLVGQLVDDGNDVVFCAGNCGQFCPDIRCGGKDRGPGNSVFGANCHPKVLSVGAVRTDTIWLGYSSQGPGQPLLGHDKPDLCAPSQFCETGDAFTTNGGTSAACALAAGVVAALRSVPVWQSSAVPPQDLKAILNGTATKTDGPTWNGRVGNGILNADAAFKKLDSIIPAPPHP